MMRILALAALFAAQAASADPAYKSATFSGGLNNVTTSLQSRLSAAGYDASLFGCSTCAVATPVGGNLIFDSSVPIPPNPPNPAIENVFSISPIDGVAASDIFTFTVGPIGMHIGDANVLGGPAIQYNNGVFNGFFFAEQFTSPNGTQQLVFNAQGGTFSLRQSTSTGPILFTGFINLNAGLMNVQDFSPTAAVPEPQTYALFIAGIFLLAFSARVRNSPIALRLSTR